MSHFDSLPEFDKEKKKLLKKFRTLTNDLADFEKILNIAPTGIGKNFTILHDDEQTKIVKARLACRALKQNSIRVIYAYNEGTFTFIYIEMYFKGDKENEDRQRIREYIERLNNGE